MKKELNCTNCKKRRNKNGKQCGILDWIAYYAEKKTLNEMYCSEHQKKD